MGASYGHKGKKHSLEARLKISASMKGSNNPKWKGGVTNKNQKMRNSVEYEEWRTAVYKRDKYTCKKCGDDKGGNLEADHIYPLSRYPKLMFKVSNGRTLCKSCHRKRTKIQIKRMKKV